VIDFGVGCLTPEVPDAANGFDAVVDIQVRDHRVKVHRIAGLKQVHFIADVQGQLAVNDDAVLRADVLETLRVRAVIPRVVGVRDQIATHRRGARGMGQSLPANSVAHVCHRVVIRLLNNDDIAADVLRRKGRGGLDTQNFIE
jgi:hypothetical protein